MKKESEAAAMSKGCVLVFAVILFLSATWAESHPTPDTPANRIRHNCIHDEIVKKYESSFVFHREDQTDSASVKAAVGTWAPIRIAVDYHNFTLGNGPQGAYLRNLLIPSAIAWVRQALSVQSVQGNLVLHKFCERWYDNPYRCVQYAEPTRCGDAIVPSSDLQEEGGRGRSNADYVLYITSNPTSGNTLAYAVGCQFNANTSRPIAGNANFGPSYVVPTQPGTLDFEYQLNTVIHEIFHALGFSSSLFPKFSDASGKPYAKVTQTFNERGHTVTKVVTPKALKMASKQFNCAQLNGVELEDQGGSGTAGSHWEKRIFNEEFITGISLEDDIPVKSAVTLAFMEDSGWYTANYSVAEFLYWGYGKGCAFAMSKCLTPNGDNPSSQFPDYFCSVPSQQSCMIGRVGKGQCNIVQYLDNLPSDEQYFSNPTEGGGMQQMDFCPFYAPFGIAGSNQNSICSVASNQPSINYWGEEYGEGSSCFLSTIVNQKFQRYLVNQGSTCHKYSCTSSTLQVYIDGNPLNCPSAGGEVTVPGFSGTFVCPAFSELC